MSFPVEVNIQSTCRVRSERRTVVRVMVMGEIHGRENFGLLIAGPIHVDCGVNKR